MGVHRKGKKPQYFARKRRNLKGKGEFIGGNHSNIRKRETPVFVSTKKLLARREIIG